MPASAVAGRRAPDPSTTGGEECRLLAGFWKPSARLIQFGVADSGPDRQAMASVEGGHGKQKKKF